MRLSHHIDVPNASKQIYENLSLLLLVINIEVYVRGSKICFHVSAYDMWVVHGEITFSNVDDILNLFRNVFISNVDIEHLTEAVYNVIQKLIRKHKMKFDIFDVDMMMKT